MSGWISAGRRVLTEYFGAEEEEAVAATTTTTTTTTTHQRRSSSCSGHKRKAESETQDNTIVEDDDFQSKTTRSSARVKRAEFKVGPATATATANNATKDPAEDKLYVYVEGF